MGLPAPHGACLHRPTACPDQSPARVSFLAQIVAFMGPLPQGSLLTCTHRHHILTLTQPHEPGCRGRDSCCGIHHQGNRRHAKQTVAHQETNLSGHGGRV